ncbi:unnamed protein product [Phytomonas sp. Hart1]|nr:unnamed protein product [Phytomonas sp. Hart1]|eukprot:CCW67424.1 unnamed protein product [Phytomonas sp. isolate Hart1]
MPKLVPAVKPRIQSRENFSRMLHNISKVKDNKFSSSLKSMYNGLTKEEIVKNLIWVFPTTDCMTDDLPQHVSKPEKTLNGLGENFDRNNLQSCYGSTGQNNMAIAVSSMFTNDYLTLRCKSESKDATIFSDTSHKTKIYREAEVKVASQCTSRSPSVSQTDHTTLTRQQQKREKRNNTTTVKVQRNNKRPRTSSQLSTKSTNDNNAVDYIICSSDKSVEGRRSDSVEIISQISQSKMLPCKHETTANRRNPTAPCQRLITSFLVRKE